MSEMLTVQGVTNNFDQLTAMVNQLAITVDKFSKSVKELTTSFTQLDSDASAMKTDLGSAAAEENDDSLDCLDELIPSPFFDEKEDSTTDEEFLIPSLFFDEENEDSTTAIVKLIPIKTVNEFAFLQTTNGRVFFHYCQFFS